MPEEVQADEPRIQTFLDVDRRTRAVIDYNLLHGPHEPKVWVTGSDPITGVLAWNQGADSQAGHDYAGRLMGWADDLVAARDLLTAADPKREYFLFGSCGSTVAAAAEIWEVETPHDAAITFAWVEGQEPEAPRHATRSLRPDEAALVNDHWDLGGGQAESSLRYKIEHYPSACIDIDGKAAAWSGLHFQTAHVGNMGYLWVQPEHRGKGLARDLTRALVRKILDSGRLPIAHVYSQNIASVRLTESEGFVRAGEGFWLSLRPR